MSSKLPVLSLGDLMNGKKAKAIRKIAAAQCLQKGIERQHEFVQVNHSGSLKVDDNTFAAVCKELKLRIKMIERQH